MAGPDPARDDERFLSRVVEAAIRLSLLAGLAAWCFAILRPFLLLVVWAAIIAVAIHPAYLRLRTLLGGRARLAAAVLVVLGLIALFGPTILLGETLFEGSQTLAAHLKEGRLALPQPPEAVLGWPVVGPRLYEEWRAAAENLGPLLRSMRPQIVAGAGWLISAAAGAGLAFAQSVFAVLIAGVLLVMDRGAGEAVRAVGRRLSGERGEEFALLAGATVRSVAQGILGVALIQSLLAGLGFLAVGLPAAGLWALIGLLCCVVQLGLLPVALPAVIYVFYTSEPLPAVAFAIWMLAVGLLDNVLKPLLLGRGVQVPLVVIFLGSLGGFVLSGILGLFVGAVVLVLGYTLARAWLDDAALAAAPALANEDGEGEPGV